MHYSELSNGKYMLRLERGEKVIYSLNRLCERLMIYNAWFIAIGSVENPIIAHYMVDTKKYTEKSLQGIFEVTNLIGNVALFGGKPLVHGHIGLSDEDMHAFGGHLVEATVSATLEGIINNLGTSKTKVYDESIGLKLFELEERI